MSIIQFEVGKTYTCKSICNSDCVWEHTITRRAEKSVWIGSKRFGVHVYDNSEAIYPEGKYSMCPVLRAENIKI